MVTANYAYKTFSSQSQTLENKKQIHPLDFHEIRHEYIALIQLITTSVSHSPNRYLYATDSYAYGRLFSMTQII